MASFNVTSYVAFLYTSANGNANAVPVGNRAAISLLDATSKAVGTIRFWDAGVALPAESTSNTGVYVGNMPFTAYAAVLDLLRNEKPITWAAITGGSFGQLSTSAEPVGEGGA